MSPLLIRLVVYTITMTGCSLSGLSLTEIASLLVLGHRP